MKSVPERALSRNCSTKLRRKPKLPGNRFVRILAIYLSSNCTGEEWYPEAHGFLRARRWDLLYRHAERLAAATYESARRHFLANQWAALILKLPFSHSVFGFEQTARETALQKFHAAEDRCARTNRRFDLLLRGRKTRFHEQLETARKLILRVLGDEPDIPKIMDLCAFGPGACIGVHGNATNLVRKFFAKGWTVSPTCAPYFALSVQKNDSFLRGLLENGRSVVCYDRDVARTLIQERVKYTAYNMVDFVPKTAKTERSIAVEPLGNTFVQRGIDLEMRSRLKLIGIDLSDQGRNAHLAKIGSETNSLSTIDLSSASDTVAIELVRYLLPLDWYLLLNNCRSPAYKSGREIRRYDKFASMGNGFCFPLETLIFWALARAASGPRGVVSVYGDDIIVTSESTEGVLRLLKFCGFVPNKSKTYVDGPFRESCGADWYEGTDVRPVYLDSPLSNDSDIMCFHNATNRSEWCSNAFAEVRHFLRELIPAHRRFLRPFTGYRTSFSQFNSPERDLQIKNLNGAFDVELDEFMCSKWASWSRDEQRWHWREWVYTPIPDDEAELQWPVGRYWMFLQGSPGGTIPLRRETRRRVTVR